MASVRELSALCMSKIYPTAKLCFPTIGDDGRNPTLLQEQLLSRAHDACWGIATKKIERRAAIRRWSLKGGIS